MLVLGSDEFERQNFGDSRSSPGQAGDFRVVSMLDRLSQLILASPEARKFPDLATFGFFCRESNVQRYLDGFRELNRLVGLGSLVHIAPGNIPMNFAFSYVMGLVSGNTNFVRLPSLDFPQIDATLSFIKDAIEDADSSPHAERSVFFKSKKGSEKLEFLIQASDGLVVWGGDATVRHFRKIEKKPLAREVYFPSRQSSAVLGAADVLELDEPGLARLVADFYNDTYLVDQSACSSPSILFWVGSEAQVREASSRFWPRLKSYVHTHWASWAPTGGQKLTDLFQFVETTDSPIGLQIFSNALWTTSDKRAREATLRFGYFLEVVVSEAREIPKHIRTNEQTVTYFGVPSEELFQVFRSEAQGRIDRICPIGRALDMGFVWDGKDSLPLMSRRVSVL